LRDGAGCSRRDFPEHAVVHDPRDLTGSPDRFGYEWQTYGEIVPEYEEQFRRWTVHLAPDDWRGQSVLDVGCGMGRNSVWPLRYGASECVAVDVDERSLDMARANLAPYPGARVMRASAYDLPFRDRFDLVFSIGVIHHLERPERALASMASAARPGGRVLIWVYGLENNRWIVSVLDPLRKALFSRLPVAVVHHISLYPTILLWAALRIGIRPIEYFRLLSTFRFRHLRSIVFDQMLPRIAHYWPRDTVVRIMEEAGLSDVRIETVNQMSWSAIGTRPVDS
jgi:SAM-dependent methyltransferase